MAARIGGGWRRRERTGGGAKNSCTGNNHLLARVFFTWRFDSSRNTALSSDGIWLSWIAFHDLNFQSGEESE
jgi:hypothetical protein